MAMTASNVVTLGKMTAAQYDAERERIRETYGDKAGEAIGLREQALASLYRRSGWTQEELAEKEKLAASHMAKKLRFGRFLEICSSGTIPRNLSERRFRSYWERTDKSERNERIRFKAVQELMQEEITLRKPRNSTLTKLILDRFADGKRHALATIVAACEAPAEEVENTLGYFGRTNNSYGVVMEKTPYGTSYKVRLVRPTKNRDARTSALLQDLGPIIEQLEAEGKKNMATASPAQVAMLTHKLKAILDKWAG